VVAVGRGDVLLARLDPTLGVEIKKTRPVIVLSNDNINHFAELAVVAEEYGGLACLALLALYAFIVMRALLQSWREPEAATRLAIVGLALIFGLQALINMGVNVGLLPAKGITLPFVSSGGSSMLAIVAPLTALPLVTSRTTPEIVPTGALATSSS